MTQMRATNGCRRPHRSPFGCARSGSRISWARSRSSASSPPCGWRSARTPDAGPVEAWLAAFMADGWRHEFNDDNEGVVVVVNGRTLRRFALVTDQRRPHALWGLVRTCRSPSNSGGRSGGCCRWGPMEPIWRGLLGADGPLLSRYSFIPYPGSDYQTPPHPDQHPNGRLFLRAVHGEAQGNSD